MKSLVFRVWRVNQLGIVLVADTTYIFVAAVSIQQSASALGTWQLAFGQFRDLLLQTKNG
jgi:hypothetical protein